MDLESSAYQARIDRLKLEDSFKDGINCNQRRPVAINEKGSNIYQSGEEDELVFFIFTQPCDLPGLDLPGTSVGPSIPNLYY